MKKVLKYMFLVLSVLTSAVLTSCSSVDCPLNNTVYATWTFEYPDGRQKLADTLDIYLQVNGKDTLVANRLIGVSSVNLPMSYYNEADTLTLELRANGQHAYEQIIVKKSNIQHFNSPECGVWVEHYISGTENEGMILDSLRIRNSKVDNYEVENIRLYLK